MPRYLDWLTFEIFKWFKAKVGLLNVEHLGLKHNELDLPPLYNKSCSLA